MEGRGEGERSQRPAEIRVKQPFPEELGGKYVTLETGVEESTEKVGETESG